MPHTEGDWRVVLVPGSYQRPALVMAGDKIVAECKGDQLDPKGCSIGEAEDNAYLLAAAPRLLAACKWIAGLIRHKAFCPAAENRGDCDCGLKRNVLDAIALAERRK